MTAATMTQAPRTLCHHGRCCLGRCDRPIGTSTVRPEGPGVPGRDSRARGCSRGIATKLADGRLPVDHGQRWDEMEQSNRCDSRTIEGALPLSKGHCPSRKAVCPAQRGGIVSQWHLRWHRRWLSTRRQKCCSRRDRLASDGARRGRPRHRPFLHRCAPAGESPIGERRPAVTYLSCGLIDPDVACWRLGWYFRFPEEASVGLKRWRKGGRRDELAVLLMLRGLSGMLVVAQCARRAYGQGKLRLFPAAPLR